MSDLVGDPEDRFSQNEDHIIISISVRTRVVSTDTPGKSFILLLFKVQLH